MLHPLEKDNSFLLLHDGNQPNDGGLSVLVADREACERAAYAGHFIDLSSGNLDPRYAGPGQGEVTRLINREFLVGILAGLLHVLLIQPGGVLIERSMGKRTVHGASVNGHSLHLLVDEPIAGILVKAREVIKEGV